MQRNKKKLCRDCGKEIWNRQSNAILCKDCADINLYSQQRGKMNKCRVKKCKTKRQISLQEKANKEFKEKWL